MMVCIILNTEEKKVNCTIVNFFNNELHNFESRSISLILCTFDNQIMLKHE